MPAILCSCAWCMLVDNICLHMSDLVFLVVAFSCLQPPGSSMSHTAVTLQVFMSGQDDIIVKADWEPEPGEPMPQMPGCFIGKKFGAGQACSRWGGGGTLYILVHNSKCDMCLSLYISTARFWCSATAVCTKVPWVCCSKCVFGVSRDTGVDLPLSTV